MARKTEKRDDLKDCCPDSHFKCIISEDSTSSIGSESSSELFDDDDGASSSSSSSLSTWSLPETRLHRGCSEPAGPEHKMKRGLSRYYQGKARTFTSLSDVKRVEDLAKKEIPFVKKGHKKTPHQSPKATILKKNTRGSAGSMVPKSVARPRCKCSNAAWGP